MTQPADPPVPPDAPPGVDEIFGGGPPVAAPATAPEAPTDILGSLKAGEVTFGSTIGGGLIPAAIHGVARHIDPEWAEGWKQNYEAAVAEADAHPLAKGIGGGLGFATDLMGPLGKGASAIEGSLARQFGTAGRIVGMGASNTALTAAYHAGKIVSEDELGDHQLNAEKLVAKMTDKDALLDDLLAFGVGSGIGALGAGAGALLKGFRGRQAAAALDAASGLESGGGRAIEAEARRAEDFMGEAARLGKTSEQASAVAADLGAAANAAPMGPARKLFDETFVEPYLEAQTKAGGKEMGQLLRKQYEGGVQQAVERDARWNELGRSLSKDADDVLRKAVDNLDDVQFTQKTEQMGKLVDPSQWRVARDAALDVWQETKQLVEFWEGTSTKGGAEGAVKRARKWLGELEDTNRGIGAIATQADKERVAAEMFTKLDQFKRQIAPSAQFGKSVFGLPEAAKDFDVLYHKVRGVLEDESVWGKAGAAQAANNAAVSKYLDKSGAFKGAFGAVELERAAGRPVLETDPGKFKSFLRSLGGAEGDTPNRVAREYLESVIERANTARAHYQIPAAQLASIEAGEKAARKMLSTLDGAANEAKELSKLELAVAGEQSSGIGGFTGLLVDAKVAPLKTMQRLAHIRRAADSFDANFGEKIARAVRGKTGEAIPKLSAREQAATVKEIQAVQRAAQNPATLIDRASDMIGDDMQGAAPRHAAAVGGTLARLVSFLATQAPKGHPP